MKRLIPDRFRRRRYLVLWALMGVVTPIGYLAYSLFGPRQALVFSEETTGFTEPLAENGYLNLPEIVLRELQSRHGAELQLGMSEEAHAESVEAFGKRADILTRLMAARGIDWSLQAYLRGMDFFTDDEAECIEDFETVQRHWFQRPFNSFEQPVVAAVIAENRDWFENLRTLLLRPTEIGVSEFQRNGTRWYGGVRAFRFNVRLPDYTDCHRNLGLRTLLAIGEERYGEAAITLRVWWRLRQKAAAVYAIPFRKSVGSFRSIQRVTGMSVLAAPHLLRELEGFVDEVGHENLMPFDSQHAAFWAHVAALERLQTQHAEDRVEYVKSDGVTVFLQGRWRESQLDWEQLSIAITDYCQSTEMELRHYQPYPNSIDAVFRRFRELLDSQTFSGDATYFLSLSTVSFSDYVRQSCRRLVERRFLRLAAELARFHAERLVYPQSLGQLQLKSIDPLALEDPFTGEKVVYSRSGNGFQLTSKGPNGEDDLGLQNPEEIPPQYLSPDWKDIRTGRRPDDIVFDWSPH